jgi:DNA-binding CsgD family transcriptional regulator
MLEADVDRVIAAVHEGVFEQPYWATLLETMRQVAKADHVSLVFRRADARLKDIYRVISGDASPELDRDLLEDILGRGVLPYYTLTPNKPYALEEIVRPGDERHADYVDYLEGRSIRDALVVRVAEPEGGFGWLTLGRTGTEDFDPAAGDLLARVAPHLAIAARTLATIERERMRAEIAADAVRRLNFGWVTFDARGSVVEIDAEAERLFRSTAELGGVARGQAFPLKGPMRRVLAMALEAFAEAPTLSPRAIHLMDEPWIDMLLAPIRYRAVSQGVTPVAVGYVHGVDATGADRCEQLMQLFSLSRSEARLALALSQGKSLAEAATALGFTLETTRNYSKRIYAKTGTRGQADLVRIILASIIALA